MQENVTLILCVCSLEEGKRTKCHKYWPTGNSSNDPAFKGLVSELQIETAAEEKISSSLTKRLF